MRISVLRVGCMFALLALPTLGVSGCGGGDDSQDPQNLIGTWRTTTIHVLTQTTNCPGEIQVTEDISVSCATETLTFQEGGSLLQVQTTDEYGDPYDWRTEGTWSTNDDLLTVMLTKEGPDADNLQSIDPPDVFPWMWSVSADTLTLGWTAFGFSVEGTFQRQNQSGPFVRLSRNATIRSSCSGDRVPANPGMLVPPL